MNYYLIISTTSDPYEMSKGVMIVSAKDRKEARSVWIESKRKSHQNEKITDIKLISSKTKKIIYEQPATIE